MYLMMAQGKCQEEVRNDRSVELLLSSAAKTMPVLGAIILGSEARDNVQSHLYPNKITPSQLFRTWRHLFGTVNLEVLMLWWQLWYLDHLGYFYISLIADNRDLCSSWRLKVLVICQVGSVLTNLFLQRLGNKILVQVELSVNSVASEDAWFYP